jgi:hypothetical protein
LKQGSFHTPFRPENGIGLAEDTPQPSTSNLKQNSQRQGYGQHNLGDI